MNAGMGMCLLNLPSHDPLSTFLATYPTKLHYKRSQFYSRLWVFWSENDEPSSHSSSYCDPKMPNPLMIQKKIRSALSAFNEYKIYGLFQFWAPVKIGSRWLLTTSNQPFALGDLDYNLKEHRLRSLGYHHNIDVNTLEVEEDPTILNGAPARAFLNGFPEFISDLRVHQGCPLVRYALESGLTACFELPIFSDSSRSCCIGVCEFYMEECDYPWGTFCDFNYVLENQGLFLFQGKARISSMNISSLQDAKSEIDKALEAIVKVNCIRLVQVWIAYEDENHVVFSFPSNATRMERISGLRLIGHCAPNTSNPYEWYFYVCGNIPLVKGKGLVERAVHNYEAHFCMNFSIFYQEAVCCSFTICLKNNKTLDLLYVLEFLWEVHDHYIIMTESLVSTLQRCLPSFNLASGAQLGDELCVIDVDDSTGMGNGYFKILKGHRSSSIPNAFDEG